MTESKDISNRMNGARVMSVNNAQREVSYHESSLVFSPGTEMDDLHNRSRMSQ